MLLTLLVSAGTMLCSLLCFAVATRFIVEVVKRLYLLSPAHPGFWMTTAAMMAFTLITAVAHLAQIALWAVVFLLCGEMPSFEAAFYLSAQNYTALGYGDLALSERWRLLGPLEAINGLLLFGLSTAVLFAVLSRLIAHELPGGQVHARP
jgi:hypothetical protein